MTLGQKNYHSSFFSGSLFIQYVLNSLQMKGRHGT